MNERCPTFSDLYLVVSNTLGFGRDSLTRWLPSRVHDYHSRRARPDKCAVVLCVMHRATDDLLKAYQNTFLDFQDEVVTVLQGREYEDPISDVSINLRMMTDLKQRLPGCIDDRFYEYVRMRSFRAASTENFPHTQWTWKNDPLPHTHVLPRTHNDGWVNVNSQGTTPEEIFVPITLTPNAAVAHLPMLDVPINSLLLGPIASTEVYPPPTIPSLHFETAGS